MPHDRQEELTGSCNWPKRTLNYHTRGRWRGGNMTWQGIFVKRTTRRGALETCGLWEKQPWAHSLGPFPLGLAALTQPSPAPPPRDLCERLPNLPLHSCLAEHSVHAIPCKFVHQSGRRHLMNFLSIIIFMEVLNWETASWLVERPILYKYAMLCMELPVANLEIDTATLIWTGMVDRIFVSCLCKKRARVEHKYSNVETSIRMRPLNSLALNDPSKFWSKKPGCRNPLSWA